jgi:hypothetical protein
MNKKENRKAEIKILLNHLFNMLTFDKDIKKMIRNEVRDWFADLDLLDKGKLSPSEYGTVKKIPKKIMRMIIKNPPEGNFDSKKDRENRFAIIGSLRARMNELVELYPKLKGKKIFGKVLERGPFSKK